MGERELSVVLGELVAVEAQRRGLERRRLDLVVEASRLGASQERLGRLLEVSQPSVSRFVSRPVAEPMGSVEREVAELVEGYEAGRVHPVSLVVRLSGLVPDQGPVPALDRAVLRGTVPSSLARLVQETRAKRVSDEDGLRALGGDELADVVHQDVLAAVDRLRELEGQGGVVGTDWRDLVRAERRLLPGEVEESVGLALACRAISGGGTVTA